MQKALLFRAKREREGKRNVIVHEALLFRERENEM